MKTIDIDTWDRKEHFQFFRRMDYPQFNICMNIDITRFLDYVHDHHLPFYYSMIYLSTQICNQIEAFRYRIRQDEVVLHDMIHPSFTDMEKGSDLFKMVTVEMNGLNLEQFSKFAAETSRNQKIKFDLSLLTGRDDFIYITSIPWISFTHLSHTITLNKDDSVPRISWGKYFSDGEKTLLPFSVQVNHALMDGVHVGIYTEKLQNYLDSL